MNEQQHQILDSGQMAEVLGVTADTIRDWANSNIIPCMRAGDRGHMLFSVPDVIAALAPRKNQEQEEESDNE